MRRLLFRLPVGKGSLKIFAALGGNIGSVKSNAERKQSEN
jgi:hypothetical protein